MKKSNIIRIDINREQWKKDKIRQILFSSFQIFSKEKVCIKIIFIN